MRGWAIVVRNIIQDVGPIRVLQILLAERTGQPFPRVPEPELVMADAKTVEAYTTAALETGALAPVYQLHLERISALLPPPGGRVVDLACGTGELLVTLAGLYPEIQFVGVDLSETMLSKAREASSTRGLRNVRWVREDISTLSGFEDGCADLVISTEALHHLPTLGLLQDTLRQVDRLLSEGGRIYLFDFGRMRSLRSVGLLVGQQAGSQHPLLVRDYEASLKAAFSVEEWQSALAALRRARYRLSMPLGTPFVISVRSPVPERAAPVAEALLRRRRKLALKLRLDYWQLRMFT